VADRERPSPASQHQKRLGRSPDTYFTSKATRIAQQPEMSLEVIWEDQQHQQHRGRSSGQWRSSTATIASWKTDINHARLIQLARSMPETTGNDFISTHRRSAFPL